MKISTNNILSSFILILLTSFALASCTTSKSSTTSAKTSTTVAPAPARTSSNLSEASKSKLSKTDLRTPINTTKTEAVQVGTVSPSATQAVSRKQVEYQKTK